MIKLMCRKISFFIILFFFFFTSSVDSAILESGKKNEKNPFGVLAFLPWNHPWNNYKYSQDDLKKAAALMRECGISFVRLDFLWNDIESEHGQFDFSKYDHIVSLLTDNGIEILGLLSYSADWAGPSWNSPPYKNETFVNYASMVIERYRDKVKYWEIWNEPDDEQYWRPQDGMVRYTSLLKDVYIAAKDIDPDCKILNGGLSKYITISLKKIYKNGGREYFDILAIHPFVNPLNPIDKARVKGIYKGCKRIMKENDDDKKIWFTELGCPGVVSPSKSNSWWLGMSPTEEQQAEWVKKIYTEIILQMPDCDKIFWAFFRDCKNYWNNGIDYWGLVRGDFSKKPAFKSYQESVKLWNESLKYKKPREKLKGIRPN
ncbi:MAG: beta-galactosidase [Candidatus Omnitrophica bacterium]|nr:beta-galactosidase [Candidatus Omnitrophota bacterium]